MNHLAHFLLSGNNSEIKLGNFIADYIPIKEYLNYNITVRDGFKLHLYIDNFTDNHPIVRKCVKQLHPTHHKYSPVILDVIYDHLLANNWSNFTDNSLKFYTSNIYDILLKNEAILPEKIRMRLTRMVSDNWLMKYQEKEGLRYALELMERRIKFPTDLSTAVDVLYENFDSFNNDFLQFFPDLQQNTKVWLVKNGYH